MEFFQLFNDTFVNKNTYIKIGQGKAKYKMSRGSFSTRDHISQMKKVYFQEKIGNRYIFGDNKITINVDVIKNDNKLEILIDGPKNFNRFNIALPAFEDEKIYGMGEQYTHLNLKRQKVKVFVSEHQQVLKIAKKFLREKIFGVNPSHKAKYKEHQTYYASTTFLSSYKYFVGLETSAYSLFEFHKHKTVIKVRGIPSKITIIQGNTFQALAKEITSYYHHQIKIPSWVNQGVILATQGGDEIMMEKYHNLKEKGCKIAGIWCQDWSGQIVTEFGSQVYWSWELDENHYKNMDAHIAELSQDGVKFLGYINTFLKKDSKMFLEAKEKNYLVKKQDDSIYFIKSTTFDAGIVDLTNPEAYSWYKEIIKKNMIRRNLAGWMADFGEYLPTDAKIYAHDAENLHNLWPTLWAKCNYDAIMEEHKENEIFFFSRAAFTSTIQYTSSMWCGDQHVDYSDEYGLGSVIPSLLSMSMSGVGVAHSDIGGYTTVLHMKRTPELFIRWMEMNIFSPILRCHEGNRPLVNAQFDHPEVIDTFIKLSNIFAKMKPYHDHVLNEYYQNDIPTIRPIFYQYDEPWAYEEKNAYLYGEDILVSPVLRKNVKTKEVHLPQGEWVQFFTNDKYSGGVIKVATPLGRPIAFYRQDSKFADLFKNITE